MDSLDKYSLFSIVLLTAVLVVLGLDSREASESNVRPAAERNVRVINAGEIEQGGLKVLKDLVAIGNVNKAEMLLKELMDKYPYDAELYMISGDIMMRKQDPVKAILEYREAVDLNPDYVDKKTPLFQGRKIKNAVEEAGRKINGALSKNPDNIEMKRLKKEMYYLLRRVAGSCG